MKYLIVYVMELMSAPYLEYGNMTLDTDGEMNMDDVDEIIGIASDRNHRRPEDIKIISIHRLAEFVERPKIIPPKLEGDVFAIKPYSCHPADNYLWVVARKLGEESYVTHMYNGSADCVGYGDGNYFTTQQVCLLDFNRRGYADV